MTNTDPTKVTMEVDPTLMRMSGYTAHGGLYFEVPFMSEISHNLWQGGVRQGLVLPKFISHIVSLYPWESYRHEHDLKSDLIVRMYDSLEQSLNQVDDIARWVNACRATGPVLVHCQAGLNRSSLVVARALILGEQYLPVEAIELIREKRSQACLCNEAFEQWILNAFPDLQG